MNYYIYENGKQKEVPKSEYDVWKFLEQDKYEFPEYSIIIDGNLHKVKGRYWHFSFGPPIPAPFVLFYYQYEIEITKGSLNFIQDDEKVEFFETYNELKKGIAELINKLELRISQKWDKR